MIDTHAHPQLKQFDLDRGDVVNRALEAGVQMICVGVDLESSRQAVELAEKYKGIWAAVGLHPNDNLHEEFDIELYPTLAQHPKVIAIGETGLDHYRTPDAEQQHIQKGRFLEQINLAIRLGKPLIIHCRDAHNDMIDILSQNPDARGVIHSFTGTLEQAERYIELGFYLGFNGIITFARDYDDVLQAINLDRILLETDAPFLAPVPFRGKRNEPAYVDYVADQIAAIKKISTKTVEKQTDRNAIELFTLDRM